MVCSGGSNTWRWRPDLLSQSQQTKRQRWDACHRNNGKTGTTDSADGFCFFFPCRFGRKSDLHYRSLTASLPLKNGGWFKRSFPYWDPQLFRGKLAVQLLGEGWTQMICPWIQCFRWWCQGYQELLRTHQLREVGSWNPQYLPRFDHHPNGGWPPPRDFSRFRRVASQRYKFGTSRPHYHDMWKSNHDTFCLEKKEESYCQLKLYIYIWYI